MDSHAIPQEVLERAKPDRRRAAAQRAQQDSLPARGRRRSRGARPAGGAGAPPGGGGGTAQPGARRRSRRSRALPGAGAAAGQKAKSHGHRGIYSLPHAAGNTGGRLGTRSVLGRGMDCKLRAAAAGPVTKIHSEVCAGSDGIYWAACN